MKKCDKCSKPAVYHITEIRDGEPEELHFCEHHFHEFMKQSGNDVETEEVSPLPDVVDELDDDDEIDDLVCPICGTTYKQFRETGRFGCPHDYAVFRERLLPLLDNIHGETAHAGKRPKRAPDGAAKETELIRLRRELGVAIDREDYEAAAAIRDQINDFGQEVDT
ncbi:MAG: UvrB/UvrC motif-containing protein [Planctomycetota bacterium]